MERALVYCFVSHVRVLDTKRCVLIGCNICSVSISGKNEQYFSPVMNRNCIKTSLFYPKEVIQRKSVCIRQFLDSKTH